MRPKIINKCKKTYRKDIEKLVRKIVSRVPEKFLRDLDYISLLDFGGEGHPMCRYLVNNVKSKERTIEIYLDNPDLTRIPFFPPLAINIHLILAINEHVKYLKAKSPDREIQAVNTSKIDYEWMYLGVWNPLLVVFKFLHYLITPTRVFRKLLRRWTNRVTGGEADKA